MRTLLFTAAVAVSAMILAAPAQSGTAAKFSFANSALSANEINDLHFDLDGPLAGVASGTSAAATTNEGSFTTVSGFGTTTVHVTGVSGVGKPGVLTLQITVTGSGTPAILVPEWTKDGADVGTPVVTNAK